MEKIIFEGTSDQIANLKRLTEFGSNDLPEDRTDFYQTDNLWCTLDVTDKYDCEDWVAMEILIDALSNDATIERIHETIALIAEDEYDLKDRHND